MSRQPNFRCEPQWIADRIVPKITLEQAQRSSTNPIRSWKCSPLPLQRNIRSQKDRFPPMQVQGLAVHNYHEQMLSLAKGSVKQFPEQQRHLLGVTVSINKDLVPTLKKELNSAVARVLDVCESDENPKKSHHSSRHTLFPTHGRRDVTVLCLYRTHGTEIKDYFHGKDKREVFRWFRINLRTSVLC